MDLRLRLKRWQYRLLKLAQRALRRDRTVYVHQRVDEYRGYWEAAARLIGADFAPLTDSIWEVRRGGRRTRIVNYVVQADDPVTLHLAGDKAFCFDVARRLGARVPRYTVGRLSDLGAAHAMLGRPLVVKPAYGTAAGLGVTLCVETRSDLERAAALVSLYCDRVIVEEMVPAESCRLLYLGGELIHAVRRRGVRVTGDGRTPVGTLLEAAGLGRLGVDRLTGHTLGAQGLTLGAVLEAGRTVVARPLPPGERRTRELRTVYDESIAHLVHPRLAEEMSRVVLELGIEFAGVDVLTNDPSVPLEESGGVLLEVNTTPGIHHHYVTAEDRRNPVAVRVLEYLLHVRRSHTQREAIDDTKEGAGSRAEPFGELSEADRSPRHPARH